jgi:hypothetical protein
LDEWDAPATILPVLVRELMALLAREDPESPITVEGLCPHGVYLVQRDLDITWDQGPAPDIDEVNIIWTADPGVERLAQERAEAEASESRDRGATRPQG